MNLDIFDWIDERTELEMRFRDKTEWEYADESCPVCGGEGKYFIKGVTFVCDCVERHFRKVVVEQAQKALDEYQV